MGSLSHQSVGASARKVIGRDGGLAPGAGHVVVRAYLPTIRTCYERAAKSERRPTRVVRLG
jgi:hypothetical protein